jgi:hypothetical protein
MTCYDQLERGPGLVPSPPVGALPPRSRSMHAATTRPPSRRANARADLRRAAHASPSDQRLVAVENDLCRDKKKV